jgi:hypothetical protein
VEEFVSAAAAITVDPVLEIPTVGTIDASELIVCPMFVNITKEKKNLYK